MKVAGERARQMLGSNDDSKGLPKEEFASPGINQQVQITMRDPDKSKTSKTSHPHTAPREELASFVGVPRSRRPWRRRWRTGGSREGQESHRHVDTTLSSGRFCNYTDILVFYGISWAEAQSTGLRG